MIQKLISRLLLVHLYWIVSSACMSGQCVQVGLLPNGDVVLGDTKNPNRLPHRFTAAEWDAFLAGARAGSFDRSALHLPTSP
jgi:Domain of unknown function (DUF397)